jgi:hypothetical protein
MSNRPSYHALTLILATLCGPTALAQPKDAPSHGRPFFMPAQERTRLQQLIATEEWAKADYTRIRVSAGGQKRPGGRNEKQPF